MDVLAKLRMKFSVLDNQCHEKVSVKGFTLIELIIVIVIISVLSAIAIPRFISQTSNARVASLNGLAGGLNSMTSLITAQYVGNGGVIIYPSSNTITYVAMADGVNVAVLTGTGLPTPGGLASAMKNTTGFSYSINSAATILTYNFSPNAITNCYVSYTNTGSNPGTDGMATATTSGC